jgi:hypothetical protein
MTVPHEFLQTLEEARPEACSECPYIEPAAKANYELAVSLGGDEESATVAGLSIIDPECEGMKEHEKNEDTDDDCIDNICCGKPEKFCGRKEGRTFLRNHAYGIRVKLIEPEAL